MNMCTCEFKTMFVFFIVFKCYISSIKYNIQISYGIIRLIYLHYIDNQLSIEWSGKCHWKSGKSQGKVREKSGNLFSHFCWKP